MWGRKAAEIADLKRRNRVQAAELAAIRDELKATRYAARTATRLYTAENTTARLRRALKACAGYREELAKQGRLTRRLTDSFLDSVGSKGEHLLPVERQLLGIDTTDEKEPAA